MKNRSCFRFIAAIICDFDKRLKRASSFAMLVSYHVAFSRNALHQKHVAPTILMLPSLKRAMVFMVLLSAEGLVYRVNDIGERWYLRKLDIRCVEVIWKLVHSHPYCGATDPQATTATHTTGLQKQAMECKNLCQAQPMPTSMEP